MDMRSNSIYATHLSLSLEAAHSPSHLASLSSVFPCVCVAGFFVGIYTTFKPFNYLHDIIKMLLRKRRCTWRKICRNTLHINRQHDRIDRYSIRVRDTQDTTHSTEHTHVRMSACKMNFRRDYNRIQLDVIAGKTSRKNVLLNTNNIHGVCLLCLFWFFASITEKFVTKREGDDGDATMAAAAAACCLCNSRSHI